LLPYLAGAVTCFFFTRWLYENYITATTTKEVSKNFLATNEEIHAVSSGAKVCKLFFFFLIFFQPVVTWFARDVIQSCRETMGGHGYSAYSRIPRLREDHDPSQTYEVTFSS
jgi:acyl-CoA oxidase